MSSGSSDSGYGSSSVSTAASSSMQSSCPTPRPKQQPQRRRVPPFPIPEGLHLVEKPADQSAVRRFYDVQERIEPALVKCLAKARERKVEYRPTAIRPVVLGTSDADAAIWMVVLCDDRLQKAAKKFFSKRLAKDLCEPNRLQVLVVGSPWLVVGLVRAFLPEWALDRDQESLCGLPLRLENVVTGDTRNATLGGIIRVIKQDRSSNFYGMTAGHGVYELGLDPDNGDESGDNAGEQEEENNDEVSDSDDDSFASESDGDDGESVISFGIPIPTLEAVSAKIAARWGFQSGEPHVVTCTSHDDQNEDHRYLDWALISVDRYNVKSNKVPVDSEDRGMLLKLPQATDLETIGGKKVLLLGGAGATFRGTISNLPSRLLLTPGRSFVDTVMVKPEDPQCLVKGASGTWVVDEDTGEVYGHLVATDFFGEGYVIPLLDSLDDIKRRLDAMVVDLELPVAPRVEAPPTPATPSVFVSQYPQGKPLLEEKRPMIPEVDVMTASLGKEARNHPGRQGEDASTRVYQNDGDRVRFPRISKPVQFMVDSYDCVVIGSGFGAAVSASKLSRTGQSVCVLERGKERWPGEYPSKTSDVLREVHVDGTQANEDTSGMYRYVVGKGKNVIVANGLGGSSLIKPGVFLEPHPNILNLEAWPAGIEPKDLHTHFENVAKVLQPQEYPEDWPRLAKQQLLGLQAASLGLDEFFMTVPQTTQFRTGPNAIGVEMCQSSLGGQDWTGVNDGSKTTALVTYLADAWNWGADIFCECEVRFIEEATDRGGYIVYFVRRKRSRQASHIDISEDLLWVHAKSVFLGAGALGSTEILLRSKQRGLNVSDQVGRNMSDNGEIVSLGYDTDRRANAVSAGQPRPDDPVGPCITSRIERRYASHEVLDGYVIYDGTIPAPIAQALRDSLPRLRVMHPQQLTDLWTNRLPQRVLAALTHYFNLFLGPYSPTTIALDRIHVFLITSHASNQAVLTLEDDVPNLEFLGVARKDHLERVHKLLEKATRAFGGAYVQNPALLLGDGQDVALHLIGGACMASDGSGKTGVVNHVGEVFVGNTTDTHEGLVVVDNAVLPTSLGVDPLATSVALADRSVDYFCKNHGLRISTEKNGILDMFGKPQHGSSRLQAKTTPIQGSGEEFSDGLILTEVMAGSIHHTKSSNTVGDDEAESHRAAGRTARTEEQGCRLSLNLVHSQGSQAGSSTIIDGTFISPVLAGSPFMIRGGGIESGYVDDAASKTERADYEFTLHGVNGRTLLFRGHQQLDSSVLQPPMELWQSAIKIHFTITEPTAANLMVFDEIVATGTLNRQSADVVLRLMGLVPVRSSLLKRAATSAYFLAGWAFRSLPPYFMPFQPLQYPSTHVVYSDYINPTTPTATRIITAQDGVSTRVCTWEPTGQHPLRRGVKDLLMVPDLGTDDQLFALPTIPTNAVNFFCRIGYRIHVAVHRLAGRGAVTSRWTAYDARLDIRAAVEHVREFWSLQGIYTVTHGVGSIAFAAGLLDGTIPPQWIIGATCAQVFAHPSLSGNSALISGFGRSVPVDKTVDLFSGGWFPCTTSADAGLMSKLLDQALRFTSSSERNEMCSSASCHRCTFAFGRCWNHTNLNDATHRHIDRFVSGISTTAAEHLARMSDTGDILTSAPLYESLTTATNLRRLHGLPILLIAGQDNAVVSLGATERSYKALVDALETSSSSREPGLGLDAAYATGSSAGKRKGKERADEPRSAEGPHSLRVIPGYGHHDIWMGTNAWRDVFPILREEVDRVVRGLSADEEVEMGQHSHGSEPKSATL